jgi:hypothetical protein
MTRDQLIETMARGMAGANYDHYGEEQLSWVAYTHEARGALTALEAAGMRVVPEVPTQKIIIAGVEAWIPGGHLSPVYEAMIDAAQEDSTSE